MPKKYLKYKGRRIKIVNMGLYCIVYRINKNGKQIGKKYSTGFTKRGALQTIKNLIDRQVQNEKA